MSDQCQKCDCRGNYQKCIETPCGHHENWINLQRIKKINTTKEKLIALLKGLECQDIDELIEKSPEYFKRIGMEISQALKMCVEVMEAQV